MREMNVVVFGGSGFIGSHLVAQLAAEEIRVTVPTRRFEKAKHLLELATVEVVEVDIHHEGTLRELVAGRDAAINLVGILHSRPGTPYGPDFARAHVELPQKIVDACALEKVPRYLHMSALGADVNGPSMYQRSKAAGELAARSHPEVAATIFRPSVVFGPEDHFMNMFARLQRLTPVVPLACPNAAFQPVFVGDVAAAFVHALADPKTRHQVYQLGGPNIYTLSELVRLAGHYSGHERPIIELPYFLAVQQAWLLELLPGEPLISRDNLESMKVDNVLDPAIGALTADALGIKLTALEAVAPNYLHPTERLSLFRSHPGR
ncbi:complex I NDUFA9 subunit family protein [Massilia horti]|uniref:Complex I NDUFA9 subunit family protein n=1 Tax=Massilia horti TaxID=2562153 RepID=A0A4Y9SXN5_9BURK|nr:complex I NDUFA9 subunit family protein [Massilia horti]TFW30109.1 complex I NDUFA9 subunit family protein [Massilia horti]